MSVMEPEPPEPEPEDGPDIDDLIDREIERRKDDREDAELHTLMGASGEVDLSRDPNELWDFLADQRVVAERFLAEKRAQDALTEVESAEPITVATEVATQEAGMFEPCDRCGARSTTRMYKGELELMFCGHHALESAEALKAQGWDGEYLTPKS